MSEPTYIYNEAFIIEIALRDFEHTRIMISKRV